MHWALVMAQVPCQASECHDKLISSERGGGGDTRQGASSRGVADNTSDAIAVTDT